jgi:hypothetical protein
LFLKKPQTILFLSLLLLFHYSRMLDYLQCPYTPPLATQAIVACDCVKQAPEKPVSNEPAQSRLMSRQRTEEVFAGNRSFILAWQKASPSWKGGRPPGHAIPCGYLDAIFQPPRS